MCRLLIPPGDGGFGKVVETFIEFMFKENFSGKSDHGPPISAGGHSVPTL